MNATLFLPYIDYYNTKFDVDDSYYTENSYENALNDEYNKNKDIVYNTINDYFDGNISVLKQGNNQGNTINFFNTKTPKIEEKTRYSTCDAILYNSSMEDCDINYLLQHLGGKNMFELIVKLNFDTIEEEFEEDLKLWVKTHNNINSTMNSDEWKFKNEPKKNIRIKIDCGEYDLIGCILLETSNDSFFIIVSEIKEVR